MKTIYYVVTEKCNLNCSHCDIMKLSDRKYNPYKVLPILEDNKKNGGHNIIFGGEPLLYKNRVIDAALYCDSITTNLTINVNKTMMSLFKDLSISVGTSYNPTRFNDYVRGKTLGEWLNHVEFAKQYTPIALLITMDKHLISNQYRDRLFYVLNTGLFSSVRFEHEVNLSNDEEFYEKANEWLYDLYKNYDESKLPFCKNFHEKEIICDCSDVYTLYSDGKLKKGCPHKVPYQYNSKCLYCDMVDICKPCQLQKYCTFPRKLIKELRKDNT